MSALKYTVIKDETQYQQYRNTLRELDKRALNDPDAEEEIMLLILLTNEYDARNRCIMDTEDPLVGVLGSPLAAIVSTYLAQRRSEQLFS